MKKEVELVPVVAGVVIKKENKYLLVQEKYHNVYGLWNFPAGRVDLGDTIEQTAIKEAKEEVGFEVKLIRKINIYQELATEPPKHAFEAEIVGGSLHYPEDEILDARWFTFEEIKELKDKLRSNWIIDAILDLENFK
jgi:8-oxo-dGTP pyrophosphatase MutT (NUDIX family)